MPKKSKANLGGESKLVSIKRLAPSPNWIDESLHPISSSLSELGQLQQTVVTPIAGTNKYKIIFGHRRSAAFLRNHHQCRGTKEFKGPYVHNLKERYYKWSKLRVFIIEDLDDYDSLEAGFLLSNLGREKSNLLEIAASLQRLKHNYEKKYPETKHGANGGGRAGKGTKRKPKVGKNITSVSKVSRPRFTAHIAKKIGMSESWVQKTLELHFLPMREKLLLASGEISQKEAHEEISRLKANIKKTTTKTEARAITDDLLPEVKELSEIDTMSYVLRSNKVPMNDGAIQTYAALIEVAHKKIAEIQEQQAKDHLEDLPPMPEPEHEQLLTLLSAVRDFTGDDSKISRISQNGGRKVAEALKQLDQATKAAQERLWYAGKSKKADM